jgi:MFS family permease
MGAAAPLQTSVLMDVSRKAQRPLWSGLGALAATGWVGSTVLGGWLVQSYGFAGAFKVAAAMQVGRGLTLGSPQLPAEKGWQTAPRPLNAAHLTCSADLHRGSQSTVLC